METPLSLASSSTSMRSVQDEPAQTKEIPRPGSRTFFERSPAGNAARAIYTRIFLGGIIAVVILIFTVLPIYWGALWKIPAHNLHGLVVDFDEGLVGQTVSQALGSNQGSSRITWTVVSSSEFPGGPESLANAVREEHTWTAISINPGSSTRLAAALANADPSYDGSRAITAYGVEARNENAYRTLIRPSIQASLDNITRLLSQQIARNASRSTTLAAVMATSPQTIVTPVYWTLDNIIPFDQPVATAATFVGMLYQLIMGFFIVVISNGAREASGYDKTLSTKSLIILRLSSTFFSAFFLSLFYCLMNLAFKLDVTRKFGSGGFMVFWMINYVGMLSVALALESLITLLTVRGLPFFLLTWIIANLSVSIFPPDVMPGIYHYGYAAPFFNLNRALRTIVFGTRNRVGQSAAVLVAWVIISCITLPLIQWFVRRKLTAHDDASAEGLTMDVEKQQKSIEHEGDIETTHFTKGDLDLAVQPAS